MPLTMDIAHPYLTPKTYKIDNHSNFKLLDWD